METDRLMSVLKRNRGFDNLPVEELRERIEVAVAALSDTYREVLADRFALNGGKPRTLVDIAAKHSGYTTERVRQMENHAIRAVEKHVFDQ